jgi:hypothetical protein
MGAGQESQRPAVGCQLVEVGGEFDAANSDSVVVVPISFVEVQDSVGALGYGGAAEQLFGGVDEPGVVADQRGADRCEPGRHGQVVAADAIDDPLVEGRVVSVVKGAVHLSFQGGGMFSESAAQQKEAEGLKVVHLGGVEHFGFLQDGRVTGPRGG